MVAWEGGASWVSHTQLVGEKALIPSRRIPSFLRQSAPGTGITHSPLFLHLEVEAGHRVWLPCGSFRNATDRLVAQHEAGNPQRPRLTLAGSTDLTTSSVQASKNLGFPRLFLVPSKVPKNSPNLVFVVGCSVHQVQAASGQEPLVCQDARTKSKAAGHRQPLQTMDPAPNPSRGVTLQFDWFSGKIQ